MPIRIWVGRGSSEPCSAKMAVKVGTTLTISTMTTMMATISTKIG